MKKVIAVTLCVIMLLAVTLTGCEKKDPLLGTWTGAISLSELFNEELTGSAEAATEYFDFSGLNITVSMCFEEDGTCALTVDKASVDTLVDTLCTQLKDGMRGYLEDTLKQSGLDISLDDYLEMMNMDLDTLIDEAMKEAIDPSDFEELAIEGYYKSKEGQLYIREDGEEFDEEEYVAYTLEGGKLTIQAPEDADEDMAKYMFPLVLNKQS